MGEPRKGWLQTVTGYVTPIRYTVSDVEVRVLPVAEYEQLVADRERLRIDSGDVPCTVISVAEYERMVAEIESLRAALEGRTVRSVEVAVAAVAIVGILALAALFGIAAAAS